MVCKRELKAEMKSILGGSLEELLAETEGYVVEDEIDEDELSTLEVVRWFLDEERWDYEFVENSKSVDSGLFVVRGSKNVNVEITNGTDVRYEWKTALPVSESEVNRVKEVIFGKRIRLDTNPKIYLLELEEVKQMTLCVEKEIKAQESNQMFAGEIMFNLVCFYSDINKLSRKCGLSIDR